MIYHTAKHLRCFWREILSLSGSEVNTVSYTLYILTPEPGSYEDLQQEVNLAIKTQSSNVYNMYIQSLTISLLQLATTHDHESQFLCWLMAVILVVRSNQ